MRKLTYILLIGILFSCSKKEEIVGSWIMLNNFSSPVVYTFEKDSFFSFRAEYKHFYKTNANIFIYEQGYRDMQKMKYKISNNTLSFYDIETDTLLLSYEKLIGSNYIDHFNEKLGVNINLVNKPSQALNLKSDDKSLYLDKDSINETRLFLSDEEVAIDSLLYLKLFNKKEQFWFSNIYLNIDKEVRISELNKIKLELRKARQLKITYITSNDKGELFGTYAKVPPVEFDYPDSIDLSLFPPLPPRANYPNKIDFFKKTILLEVNAEQFLVNDTLSSIDNFYTLLKDKLIKEECPIVYFYINENLEYEKYINLLIDTRNIYYSVRNQFSKEHFNENEYKELYKEQSDSIVSLFPMMISEIDNKELQEIKKYAL